MLKQVLTESLTNTDKEFSSKKIMTFMSFNFCIFMAIFDQFTAWKLNETVFYSFMLMASGQSVLSIVGNKLQK